jgi:hypothetical protein
MHLGALVDDDERALELTGVLAVDAEVRLQRQRHLHARRNVHERATRPDGAVERRELVVLGRHDRAEVLAEDVRVFLEALVGAHEHDAELRQLLLDGVIDDLGVVLRAHAGEEHALRLRDAEPLECLLDLVGDVVPRLLLALRRLAVVDDLVEVDMGEVRAPRGHAALEEVVVRAQTELAHPVGLVLQHAQLHDGVASQPALGLVEIDDLVLEVEARPIVVDELALRQRHGVLSPAVAGPVPVLVVILTTIIGIMAASVNDERRV